MRKLLINANFHVDVDQGEGKPPVRKHYTKGMIVEEADLPEGHTADDWLAKDLASEAADQA